MSSQQSHWPSTARCAQQPQLPVDAEPSFGANGRIAVSVYVVGSVGSCCGQEALPSPAAAKRFPQKFLPAAQCENGWQKPWRKPKLLFASQLTRAARPLDRPGRDLPVPAPHCLARGPGPAPIRHPGGWKPRTLGNDRLGNTGPDREGRDRRQGSVGPEGSCRWGPRFWRKEGVGGDIWGRGWTDVGPARAGRQCGWVGCRRCGWCNRVRIVHAFRGMNTVYEYDLRTMAIVSAACSHDVFPEP